MNPMDERVRAGTSGNQSTQGKSATMLICLWLEVITGLLMCMR